MTTRDAFLDLLESAPARTPIDAGLKRFAADVVELAAMPQPQRRINAAMAAAARSQVPSTAAINAAFDRPANADEIDAMVRALVDAGDVVLDVASDQYRAPRWRRYRFGG